MDRISIDHRNDPQSTVKRKKRMRDILKSRIFIWCFGIICSLLLVLLIFPVFRVTDDSMEPNLHKGDIILALPLKPKNGRVAVVRYGSVYIVRRVIAQGGETLDIDKNGNIYIESLMVDEPYIERKSMGVCDIELPFEVPEERFFLIGDNRETSIDSRSSVLGCVSESLIEGCAAICIWPIKDIGII